MATYSILGICGALRAGSTNRQLLREAVRHFAPARYEEADLRLPLYDGDLEEAEGIPPEVARLADQIARADAVLISTPEYNKALSGVLKNALDWVSRTEGDPWAGKPVAIMSAAAGRSGGERAQSSLRLALAPFQARLVAGPEVLIAAARSAFDEAGRLTNPRSEKALASLMDRLKEDLARG
ncbi:MAG: NAD(P)H-dependent oxidoreductase [Paracoccaceae bacterium]